MKGEPFVHCDTKTRYNSDTINMALTRTNELCVSAANGTLGSTTYYIHTNSPRDTLSEVSWSEVELALVMQAVEQILLLEFQFFFFLGGMGGGREAVKMSGKGKGQKHGEREKFLW